MKSHTTVIPATLFLLSVPLNANVVQYDCNVLPEEAGFERNAVYDPEGWIQDGWFLQSIDVGQGTGGAYDGDYDAYHYDLTPFIGFPFFIEWRMMTDAPNSEVDVRNGGAFVVLVGGGPLPL